MWLLRQCYSPLSINNPQSCYIWDIRKIRYLYTHLPCCTKIILYITRIKRQKKLTVKRTWNCLKIWKWKDAAIQISLKKNYFHQTTIIYNYEKRHCIYTRSYAYQILSYKWYISASTSQIIREQNPFSKLTFCHKKGGKIVNINLNLWKAML